jgi:hypothetical protein
MFKSGVLGFHSTDSAGNMQILGFIYSPLIFIHGLWGLG